VIAKYISDQKAEREKNQKEEREKLKEERKKQREAAAAGQQKPQQRWLQLPASPPPSWAPYPPHTFQTAF
jgi:hypothetical protein